MGCAPAAKGGRLNPPTISRGSKPAAPPRLPRPTTKPPSVPLPQKHVVTIELTSAQYAMAQEVADYDFRHTVEAFLRHELREAVLCCHGCVFGLSEAETRQRYDGQTPPPTPAEAQSARLVKTAFTAQRALNEAIAALEGPR